MNVKSVGFVRVSRAEWPARFFLMVALLAAGAPALAPAADLQGGQLVGWGEFVFPYVEPGTVFTNISAKGYSNLAIDRTGKLFGWGSSIGGQLALPEGLSNVTAFCAGNWNAMALKDDGTVQMWGSYYNAQNKLTNVIAHPAVSNIVAISLESQKCLGLRSDGTVLAWDGTGALLNYAPAGLSNVIAIASGYYHTLTLKQDGSVVSSGQSPCPAGTMVPANLSNVVAISAGDCHSLALKNDGTVVAWGSTTYHQTEVPISLSNVVAIAAGSYHSLALKSDGTVVAWGANVDNQNNVFNQATVPAGLSNVVAIAAGTYHSVALRRDGSLLAWGSNYGGESIAPGTLTDAVAVSAGYGHGLVIRGNGTVVAWGNNDYGQATVPPGLSNVIAIVAGEDDSLALKRDRTVVGWGKNSEPWFPNSGRATPPTWLSNVVGIAAAWTYSLALRGDGTIAAWGDNNYGQADLAATLSNIVGIATYPNLACCSLALQQDGTVIGWSTYGSDIGPLNGVTNIASLAVGACTLKGLAVNSNKTLVVWGSNTFGQTNLPPGLSNVTAAAVGYQHNLALTGDGTIRGWGTRFTGTSFGGQNCDQVTPPGGLGNVVSISAGRSHSLAIAVGLKISSVGLQGQVPVIRFRSFAGQQYTVEYSTDLTTANWQPLPGGPIIGDGYEQTAYDPDAIGAGVRFYRVRRWQVRQ